MYHTRLQQRPLSRTAKRTLVLSILACIVFITYLSLIAVPTVSPALHSTIAQAEPGKIPLAFIPNMGQARADVLFQAYDLNSAFFVTASDLIFAQTGEKGQAVVRVTHENAQPAVDVKGINRLKGQVNYILGRDPAKWLTHLPAFGSVLFSGLYPGIDMEYAGLHGAFESTYYVHPGADPSLIRWRFTGLSGAPESLVARLNTQTGSIELYEASVKDGQPVIVVKTPTVYQQIDGKQVLIPSAFTQNADNTFSYSLSAYDPTATLVIDPTLVYSSYFGGGKLDSADGIALDSSGNIYVTGLTSSTDFPTSNPIQAANEGSDDIFVIKLNPDGTEMLYSTYLGGSDDEEANGIAVDSTGSVYLAGDTTSNDFPMRNAYDSTCVQIFDICIPEAFLARLNADGSQLMYSTYLGGSEPDMAQGVAVGSTGQAYVTGVTYSTDFPTRSAAQASLRGGGDAFVTSINTSASGNTSLVWSTFLGGSSEDLGAAIAWSGSQLVVAGETTSSNFPTGNPLQGAYKGNQDVFITAMTGAGVINYSTYLGGAGQDTAYGIAANAQGAYLTGTTTSTDFPTLAPIQSANKGGNDAFITGINAGGSAWLFSTYMGGTGADYGYGVAVSSTGSIYVAGSTTSANFTLKNTLQAYTGGGDAFVAKIQSGGSTLDYSTLLGGSDSDLAVGIATDNQGKAYVAGNTFSTNYPLQDPLETNYAGYGDVFVSVITDAGDNPPPVETPVTDPTISIPNLGSINPLFGSFKIASSVVLPKDETIKFTILLHNSSMKDVTSAVVDELPTGLDYKDGTANLNGTYNAATRKITWSSVPVPANGEVLLTFDCTTTVDTPKLVINTANISVNQETIKRYFAVQVGAQLPVDISRPVVDSFWIGDKDVLTSRNVTLHIQAHDNTVVERMFIQEWQVNPKPVPHWEIVKNSKWIDYAETYNWQLGSQSGVHYLAVVVADDARNASIPTKNAIDFASLLLSNTQIGAKEMIPYLVSYDANTAVKATLAPSVGNPRIFVWYPGNLLIPDQDCACAEVKFTTPRHGTYYFLMYSATDATYTLNITPGGGPTWKAPGSPAPVGGGQSSALQSDPVLSKIGFDPFGSGTGGLPTGVQDIEFYIPLIGR